MERYITFIRDTFSGEEFVSTRRAGVGAHKMVLMQEAKQYPVPKYHVHTTYTEEELKDIIESVRRMSGSTYLAMENKVNVEGSEGGFRTGLNLS